MVNGGGNIWRSASGKGVDHATADSMGMVCHGPQRPPPVDGVYSADPGADPHTVRYDHITHQKAIERNPRVMDASALALCRENDLPILVFDVTATGAIDRVAEGGHVGTLVSSSGPVA